MTAERSGPPSDGRVLPVASFRSIEAAIDALTFGQLVGIPTETVYGVAALANEEGARRLIAAKDRDAAKGIPLLLDSVDQAASLAVIPDAARRLAAHFWPGALTIVVPLRHVRGAPALLTGGRRTIGLRVPDHDVPRSLARALGPIAVTSANRSGEPPAVTAEEVISALGDSIALVIDAGRSPVGAPSTVVDVAADGSFSIVREGAIERAAIEAVATRPA